MPPASPFVESEDSISTKWPTIPEVARRGPRHPSQSMIAAQIDSLNDPDLLYHDDCEDIRLGALIRPAHQVDKGASGTDHQRNCAHCAHDQNVCGAFGRPSVTTAHANRTGPK